MKIIDRLLIKAFILSFIGVLGVTISILVLKEIWIYIDDMANKGASVLLLLEMVFYMSISFIPVALPMGILFGSLLVIGAFAESYELVSMQVTGTSLWRIVMPLLGIALLVGIFSIYCSDQLVPSTNLHFKTRLHDIRNQKPTFSLEEGVFNNDFEDFSLRIGKKSPDGQSIADVLMYDQTKTTDDGYSMLTAQKGKMYNTFDEKFFVMKLEDGHRFSEMNSSTGSDSYPFIRTSFKNWTKVFDLSEFDLNRTDIEQYKSNYRMLGIGKLHTAIEAINEDIYKHQQNLISDINRSYHSFELKEKIQNKPNNENEEKVAKQLKEYTRKSILIQELNSNGLSTHSNLLSTFSIQQQQPLLRKAKSLTRGVQSSLSSTKQSLQRIENSRIDYCYTLHQKLSLAFACLLFLFIGAPMGAIIRKGGYGLPSIIAVSIFTIFLVMGVFFKKLAEANLIDGGLAAWMPCLILMPIGILLTYFATVDSKILNINRYLALFE